VAWKHVAVVLGFRAGHPVCGRRCGFQLVPRFRFGPPIWAPSDYAYLGKSQFSSDPYFDGQIDEFRVYGRALSAAGNPGTLSICRTVAHAFQYLAAACSPPTWSVVGELRAARRAGTRIAGSGTRERGR